VGCMTGLVGGETIVCIYHYQSLAVSHSPPVNRSFSSVTSETRRFLLLGPVCDRIKIFLVAYQSKKRPWR